MAKNSTGRLWFIGVVAVIPLVSLIIAQVVVSVSLERHVTGRLKRAADANSLALAEQELSAVLDYAEANDMTSGYSNVFWSVPAHDVGFWYTNLESARNELRYMISKGGQTPLETSNQLMKLRETLVDSGHDGSTSITVPPNFSWYPHPRMWAFAWLFVFCWLVAGGGYLLVMLY